MNAETGDESIFLKPNEFMKPKARTMPINPPKKPKTTPS